MMQKKSTRFFFFKRGWLYLKGTFLFGPGRIKSSKRAVRRAMDAFESHYNRLPNTEEQRQLVQKLSWYDQQRRIPTPEEAARLVQQLTIK